MSLLEFEAALTYPSGFHLDATFQAENEVTALIGPSGSGKTTILSILAGLRAPQRGMIRLNNQVLFDSSRRMDMAPERRGVGYVFQDYLVFPHLNVRRNLEYGLKRSRGAARVDLSHLIEQLELAPLLDRWPQTLSGGERQRVAFGRALLSDPRLLLLDEPLSAVDADLRSRILEFIQSVLSEARLPALYVTHNHAEAERLASRIIRIENGKIQESEVRK